MTTTEPTTYSKALESAQAEHAEGSEEGTAETPAEAETPATPKAPQTIKVKVNGVEQEITLEEAAQGYQRQADYTRKTQDVAARQQELEQAAAIYEQLNENPAATLARLAELFEVDSLAPPEELDPLEREVQELKTFAEQQREAQFQTEVENEISRIQAEYKDPELVPTDLLQHAVDRGINNLDAAYRDMKFGSLQEIATKQREADEATALAAKQAAAVVEGGTNRAAGATSSPGGPPKSLREAWAAAEQDYMA